MKLSSLGLVLAALLVAPPIAHATPSDAIDLHACELTPERGPSTLVADWPVTAAITSLALTPSGMDVRFSKRDGADRWPDVVPPGWDGPIQYTVWFGAMVDGHCYFAASLNVWHRDDPYGGPMTEATHFPRDLWYLNRTLAGHTPAVGEKLGIFLTAGAERGVVGVNVLERSNVVVVDFPGPAGQAFIFDTPATPPPAGPPTTAPEPPQPPTAPSGDLSAVLAKLDALTAKVDALTVKADDLAKTVATKQDIVDLRNDVSTAIKTYAPLLLSKTTTGFLGKLFGK